MTANRAMAVARAIVALAAMAPSLAVQAQDNPYQGLRHYDFQDRRPVMAIRQEVLAAGQDRAKQAVIETGLIGVLQDPASTVAGKQEATRLLLVVGSAKSVPVLAKLLPDPAMNNIARYGLERNADPSAAAALRSALGTSKGTALVGIINSLGNRGDAASVPALRKLAVSADPLVSDAAITALGKVGTQISVAALKSLPSKGLAVYNALLRSAGKLAANGKRAESLRLYGSLTAPSYPAVIRAGALQGMAAQNAPQAGSQAMWVIGSTSDANLQRTAASVAGRLTGKADTQRAIAGFAKLPAPAQAALLTAWSDRREIGAASVATSTLKSDDSEVRAAAIRAASRIGGAAAVPALAEIAAGGDQAQVARESLASMSGAGVQQALESILNGSGSADLRSAVIGILSERPGQSSLTALMGIAGGQDPRLAAAALKALGRMGVVEQEPRMVEILVAARQDEVRDAAQSAIVAISQRSGDRNAAAGPLLSAYEPAAPAGKVALIAALAEVGGDRALEVLTQAASSSDADIHGAALNALANTWSDSRALPTLLKLSKDGASRSDRVVALRGYLRLVGLDERALTEDRLSRIQAAMQVAERPEEKRQALSVLRGIRSPGAVTMAAAALDDPQLVAEAADAILFLASKQRRNNRDVPPVTGPEVQSALDKVIRTVNDENVKAQAQKLRQG